MKLQNISVQCLSVDQFSREEILAMIPGETLAEIKQKDAHPFFQVYSVAHEGTTRPLTIIGDSPAPISWPRRAINSIKNLVLKGVKFFMGHNADNSTQGRRALAEVVADQQREIDGVLHHVVIAHVPPENVEEIKKYNVCSQEAACNIYTDEAGSVIVDSVDKITGIALANSAEEQPGFPGALRLGMIQAFEEGQGEGEKTIKGEPKKMELKDYDFTVLVNELRNRNVAPLQVFSIDEIKSDKNFAPIFKEVEELKEYKTKFEEKEKEFLDLKTENEKLTIDLGKTTAKERLEKMLDEKKATERQKSFVLKRAGALADVSDKGLESFIDNKLEDYKTSVEILGVEEEILAAEGEQSETKTTDKNDYSKEENNEFLESDLEV